MRSKRRYVLRSVIFNNYTQAVQISHFVFLSAEINNFDGNKYTAILTRAYARFSRETVRMYVQKVLRMTSSCKFSSSEVAVCLTLACLSHLGLPHFPFVFLPPREIRVPERKILASANKHNPQLFEKKKHLNSSAVFSLCNTLIWFASFVNNVTRGDAW